MGAIGLGWGPLATWSAGAEVASVAIGALALKAHRAVLGMELAHRRRLIEARKAEGTA